MGTFLKGRYDLCSWLGGGRDREETKLAAGECLCEDGVGPSVLQATRNTWRLGQESHFIKPVFSAGYSGHRG